VDERDGEFMAKEKQRAGEAREGAAGDIAFLPPRLATAQFGFEVGLQAPLGFRRSGLEAAQRLQERLALGGKVTRDAVILRAITRGPDGKEVLGADWDGFLDLQNAPVGSLTIRPEEVVSAVL